MAAVKNLILTMDRDIQNRWGFTESIISKMQFRTATSDKTAYLICSLSPGLDYEVYMDLCEMIGNYRRTWNWGGIFKIKWGGIHVNI